MSRLLAIETSCDETAAAILEGRGTILAQVVHSQVTLHSAHGGVVPEIASRSHLEILPAVIERTLREAAVSPEDLDAFAATVGPGLAPALLVGANVARGLALGARKPFLAVNHLEGHLLSPFFGEETIPPHVGLIASGGHTLLFDVKGFRDYRLLGRTRDDAAGEAFDKAAKMLGLGYPGGVEVARLSAGGDPTREDFPRPMLDSGDENFSFSGLKTAVRRRIEGGIQASELPDICAGFQEAVVETLVTKLLSACRKTGRHLAALSGGVSANTRLAAVATERLTQDGIELRIARPSLRMDNALMIAYVAALEYVGGHPPTDAHSGIAPNFHPETFPAFS